MNIESIRNEEELEAAFSRVEELWEAEEGTDECEELELLSILIENYENEHYPIQDPHYMESSVAPPEQLKASNANSKADEEP